MSEVVHIASHPICIGSRVRQRCAWCGAVIDDTDLRGLGVAVTPGDDEPPTYPTWPTGAYIVRDGNATYVVKLEEADEIPAGACWLLDPEVTV